MSSSIANSAVPRHLLKSETRPKMARASLRKTENDRWREVIGNLMLDLQGTLTLKEFADLLGKEERQVGRWIDGTENAQLHAIFAVERFRQPLILGLAALAGMGIEIETHIRMRRIAS